MKIPMQDSTQRTPERLPSTASALIERADMTNTPIMTLASAVEEPSETLEQRVQRLRILHRANQRIISEGHSSVELSGNMPIAEFSLK